MSARQSAKGRRTGGRATAAARSFAAAQATPPMDAPSHPEGTWPAFLRGGTRLLGRVTSAPRLPPVQYSLPLVGFVALLWVACVVIGIHIVGGSGDWLSAVLGSLLVAAANLFTLPSLGGLYASWSVSVFFHLAFGFAIGPPAFVTMAIGAGLGNAVSRRPGWFRTTFNIANHFVTMLVAWLTFHAIAGPELRGYHIIVSGAVAGAAALVISYAMIGAVLRLATPDFRLRSWFLALARLSPYYVGFGVAASGASILYQFDGSLGLLTPLVPIILVQASLLILARRVQAHDEANSAHAREREALLQRAVEASEKERARIAADLHDGVVQDLAALTYACSAVIMNSADMSEREHSMAARLKEAADTTRVAMRELRTLMIELAPPRLHEDGLQSALGELLSKLERSGITTQLSCPGDIQLEDRELRLVYRVAQEALRNILKHAQCDHVWVTVGIEDGLLEAIVRDDGRGFSSEERTRRQGQGHNGLGMLKQTVADGGGTLSVRSVPGGGTSVVLRAPLRGESPAPSPS